VTSKTSLTIPLDLTNQPREDLSNGTHERIQHQLQEVSRSSFSQVEAWHPYELAVPQILFFAEEANPET
jgi:hypothetical protein